MGAGCGRGWPRAGLARPLSSLDLGREGKSLSRAAPPSAAPARRGLPGAAAGLTALSCSSRSFILVPGRPRQVSASGVPRPRRAAGSGGRAGPGREREAEVGGGGGRQGGASEATGGSAAPPPPAPPAPRAPDPAPGQRGSQRRCARRPAPYLGRARAPPSLKGPCPAAAQPSVGSPCSTCSGSSSPPRGSGEAQERGPCARVRPAAAGRRKSE